MKLQRNRQLKEHFILRLYDMMVEIIKELTKIEGNKDVTSNQVLLCARQVEAQRMQTAVLNNLKVNQENDAIWSEMQKKKTQA